MIKQKKLVFKSKGGKWYASIDGCFFYWSNYLQAWRKSRDQGRTAIECMTACREGRVMMLTLKGKVIA